MTTAADSWHLLAHRRRSRSSNRRLGALLAFVAGAVNAGGFLAVQRYTSHMSGVVATLADALALGEWLLAAGALGLVLSFVSGAATTALLVHWARRRGLQGQFALPLLLEALLLLGFGVLGARLQADSCAVAPLTALLLCFLMGLQNAMISKASQAEIRTTHMTGVVTDLGVELGRLLYWNRAATEGQEPVRADREKLAIHATLLAMFFGGGVLGALAFQHVGFLATLPLAGVLLALAAPPLWADLQLAARPRPC
jgi:uncharacterized membrane protein YoaK (UPF0700 family)